MATDKKTLGIYITEQRRFHDELTSSFNTARGRITTYIGVILAFLAFLYSGALDSDKTATEKLFIPPELYGQIFYSTGLFMLLYALGRLIHGSRPNGSWDVAFQSEDCGEIESVNEARYLVKLKNDYESARAKNITTYNKKYEAIKDSFYPLLLGAIILIVLRYFQ